MHTLIIFFLIPKRRPEMSTIKTCKEKSISKGKGHKPPNPVKCPRCGSPTMYNGFHPIYGFQKYKCKNPDCRYQFIPQLSTLKKTRQKAPSYFCPKCGAKMYVFKNIPDGIRLRCANYRKKGKNRCTHKMNIPFPGEKSFNISKDPADDLFKLLPSRFFWNKMKYSPDTVSLALWFTAVISLPAKTTSFILSYLFNLPVSHDTITRWKAKAALSWHKKLGPLYLPFTSSLHFDETCLKENGKKVWVWLGYDQLFSSITSYHISYRRATQFARNTLARVPIPQKSLQQTKIITDGLHSYKSAISDLPGFSSATHHIFSDFTQQINNNSLERIYGSLKDLARRFRGFKNRTGIWSFLTCFVYLHNYFWIKENPPSLCPAEKLNLKLPPFRQRWKFLCQMLS
jgi:transposase-like protein